ncbi:hypothetical protein [Arvimicrobium flavum]|uniref:hypothetical protein n=1 Tax=Arvimicrobium flavum TaxID=3393320 RepID=UPI00237A7437|nr:hypothetical protein [Mesorhizobium shangrilense]
MGAGMQGTVNGGRIGNWAFYALMLSLPVYALILTNKFLGDDAVKVYAANSARLAEPGRSFQLVDPHTVEEGGGWKTAEAFNFESRRVLGHHWFGTRMVDVVIPFEAYADPGKIEEARAAGCRIAVQVKAALADYDFGVYAFANELQVSKEMQARADGFQQAYCPAYRP